MHYIFSLAREADASAVFTLYQSLIGTPGCTWSESYPTKAFVQEDIQANSLYILKDEQSEIIAVASAGGERELDDLDWQPKTPCELARVGVALSHQHQGVGSYLLKHVITAVQQRDFDGIIMLVNVHNPAAIALYEKHGFARCGAVNRYSFDFYRYQMSLHM